MKPPSTTQRWLAGCRTLNKISRDIGKLAHQGRIAPKRNEKTRSFLIAELKGCEDALQHTIRELKKLTERSD